MAVFFPPGPIGQRCGLPAALAVSLLLSPFLSRAPISLRDGADLSGEENRGRKPFFFRYW